jgi:dTDP-4-dehydrorhamnose 3,5-epimerase
MILFETSLKGAFLIQPEKREDERGFFARTWCQREFAMHGLATQWVQCNISFNKRRGTLRGMHYQASPYGEAKLVRCTRGAIYDVVIDLRPDSSTFKHHLAIVLSAQNYKMLYIPEGMAHGFQTLENNSEVSYQMSQFYAPDYGRGVRWDDPAFKIPWPDDERIISARDRKYPDFLI